MFGPESLERPYRGYVVEGSAESLGPNCNLWVAIGSVLLKKPNSSVLMVDRYQNPILAYEDGDLAAWFGLGIAEISVDQFLPPPAYYLTPMNVAWAIDILRSSTEDHHTREIRRPKLYEALTFLDLFLDKKNWLVRRYRYALRATPGIGVRRWSSGKSSGFVFAASSRLASKLSWLRQTSLRVTIERTSRQLISSASISR
jgi:hypothetical protein